MRDQIKAHHPPRLQPHIHDVRARRTVSLRVYLMPRLPHVLLGDVVDVADRPRNERPAAYRDVFGGKSDERRRRPSACNLRFSRSFCQAFFSSSASWCSSSVHSGGFCG